MYGVIHQALTRWLRSLPNGSEVLREVLERSNIEGNVDDFFRYYSDTETMGLLPVVSEITGYSVDDVMYEAGLLAIYTFIENGFEPVIRTLGDTFFEILANLDSLHDNFLASFPQMKSPSVRPVRNPDDSLSIHYFSARAGLAPFMMGSLKAAAQILFDLEIDIHHRVKKGSQSDHDVFHAFVDPTRAYPPKTEDIDIGAEMSVLDLNRSMTSKLFPWHFAVNRDMKVVSLGKSLASRMKKDSIGVSMVKLFRIVTPAIDKVTFNTILELTDKPFLFVTNEKRMLSAEEFNQMVEERMLERRSNERLQNDHIREDLTPFQNDLMNDNDGQADQDDLASDSGESRVSSVATSANTSVRSSVDMMDVRLKRMRNASAIKLHGQMILDEEHDLIFFAGNPPVKSNEELVAQGVTLKELPIHCHGREMLYSAMYQTLSAQNSTDIQEKLATLDASMAEVNAKKEQIDGLLHSILPPKVAESLAQGCIPEAEKYEKVSILFSDIAGFTSISSEIPSVEVMEMLHELFVKFDDLADKHGCYKVETIGDAYMVACGCPDACEDHAERIAALAIDMVRTANSVTSPLDGEPVRIRVGLHSGPLMAGVVGRDRPRYCLFGDTVNVASRMESNGIPGCIQATYRFIRELPCTNSFAVAPRGFIEIKGKGTMKTFILLGWADEDEPPLLPPKDQDPELSTSLMLAAMNPKRFGANVTTKSDSKNGEVKMMTPSKSFSDMQAELLKRQSAW